MNYAEIVFTGIITFIAAMGERPMSAIAIHAPEPVLASNGETIPAHATWLRFDVRDLADDSPVQPDLVIERDGVSHGVVWLQGENVSVATPVDERDLMIAHGVPGNGVLPSQQNQAFLYWVPRLREILGREHTIDPRYLEREPDPALVSMRFELTRGQLATSLVAPIVWEFRPAVASPVRRAMAQEVTLKMAPDGPLVLEAKKFRDGAVRQIRFNRSDVRVMIGNTGKDDVVPAAHHHMESDPHFELYYRIFADVPRVKPIPYRADRSGKRRVIAHRAGGANCGPAQEP